MTPPIVVSRGHFTNANLALGSACLYDAGLIPVFTNERLEAVVGWAARPPWWWRSLLCRARTFLWTASWWERHRQTLEIPAGRRRFTVRKAGSAEWTQEVELLSGSRVTLTAQLNEP
jgi:hypothetical protein